MDKFFSGMLAGVIVGVTATLVVVGFVFLAAHESTAKDCTAMGQSRMNNVTIECSIKEIK